MAINLKGVVSGLALAAASLVVSVTAVEFTGRSLGLWHPTRAFRYNAVRGYELTPNEGDVNSLGFRGPEISSGRRAGTVRIVVLGDSFTYGEGVTAAEALPAQLEHLLNQRRSGRFEVFHLGVPGYNSAQEFAYLKEAGLALKPDLVVVAFTLSDADLGSFGTHSTGHTTLIRIKELLKTHVGLYDFVRLKVRSVQEWLFRSDPATAVWPEMYPLTLATRGRPSPGWDQCQLALHGMATECHRAGIPPGTALG